MRRVALLAFRIAIVPTIVLAAVALAVPGHASLVAHIWLVVVLTLVALTGIGALRRTYAGAPAPFAQAPRRPDGPSRLPSLERIERELALATASAYDVHFRLRPTLRAVARELLAARRGIGLDRSPERAQPLLGDETWDLVRPDREPPSDPRGPGLERLELTRVVESLERI